MRLMDYEFILNSEADENNQLIKLIQQRSHKKSSIWRDGEGAEEEGKSEINGHCRVRKILHGSVISFTSGRLLC